MFHDKLGVLRDEQGDMVVFQGSANETPYALLPDFNFESISVFPSWRPELYDHFHAHERRFEMLWENNVRDTVVVPFPEVGLERLQEIHRSAPYPNVRLELDIDKLRSAPDKDEAPTGPSVPNAITGELFKIQGHQRRALQNWQAHDFNGIFEHATGSGKTIAAVYGATKLWGQVGRLFLVVSVPYQNLADQWVAQLRIFGWRAIECYRSRSDWETTLHSEISAYLSGISDAVCVVVVMRTLASIEFRSAIESIDADQLLFVGDECHHFGGRTWTSILPQNSRYRLGLSATPVDAWSTSRNERLKDYFGPIVDRFSLTDALSQGVLTPYTYEVILCELNEDEAEEYLDLTSRIGRLLSDDYDEDEDSRLRALLGRRARLLAHCRDKFDKLRDLVTRETDQALSLFYCGDGAVEGDALESSMRHVEAVTSTLHASGWKSSIFTAEESLKERRQILSNFEARLIDAIVAIRCLDEGIDVPACRTAYILASSRNSRQFVQRRGRILRRAPGKESAKIVDFVVTLGTVASSRMEDVARRLFKDELKRVLEFAATATNFQQVHTSISDLLDEYDLSYEFAGSLGDYVLAERSSGSND